MTKLDWDRAKRDSEVAQNGPHPHVGGMPPRTAFATRNPWVALEAWREFRRQGNPYVPPIVGQVWQGEGGGRRIRITGFERTNVLYLTLGEEWLGERSMNAGVLQGRYRCLSKPSDLFPSADSAKISVEP